jgi:hypothetical protein
MEGQIAAAEDVEHVHADYGGYDGDAVVYGLTYDRVRSGLERIVSED